MSNRGLQSAPCPRAFSETGPALSWSNGGDFDFAKIESSPKRATEKCRREPGLKGHGLQWLWKNW